MIPLNFYDYQTPFLPSLSPSRECDDGQVNEKFRDDADTGLPMLCELQRVEHVSPSLYRTDSLLNQKVRLLRDISLPQPFLTCSVQNTGTYDLLGTRHLENHVGKLLYMH